MEASTVFLDTARPSRRSWARTLGEPQVPPEASKQALTAAAQPHQLRLVSGGREPPPPALLEPYVTVSRHTAPTVRRGVEARRCQ